MRQGMGRASGFTLIELMITLTVVVVLAGIAIPAFSHMQERNQLAATSNALRAAFAAARQSAIDQNRPVCLCAGDRRSGCDGDWTQGRWLVFRDRDHDGMVDAGESVIRAGRVPGTAALAIAGNGPMNTGVVYTPSGRAERVSGAFAAGTLQVCVADAIRPNAVDLVLSATGRVRAAEVDLDGGCPAP